MSADDWEVANRQYLHMRIGLVRDRLAAFIAARDGVPVVTLSPDLIAWEGIDRAPAIERVRAGFGLSPFETDVLVLCAGAEIDANVRALCAAIEGSQERAFPTLNVALAALPGAHWSAVHPAAALRYWKLIEQRGNDGLIASALRIDERILHFLFGVTYRDPRLAGLIADAPPPAELVASHDAIAARAVTALTRAEDLASGNVVSLCGDERVTLLAIASAAAARVGLRLQMIRASDVPPHAADRETLARLWEREAVLEESALVVDLTDGPENAANVASFVDGLAGVVFIAGRDPVVLSRRTAVRFDVARATPGEQRALWRDALGGEAVQLDRTIEQLAAHFTLPVAAIRSVAQQVSPDEDGAAETLWQLCRLESRTRLDSLAQRIDPAAMWEDIVLPDGQVQILREIAAHVRQRHRVYEQWGFSARVQRDLGITALFAGSSGTGKTLAAEILANELQLDLYRIDLSQMVSKYIGETEKNLRRIFDAGEEGGAILLFDEADALFGRRSEVRDSHDRYANLEVSYLLQRMESYRGLAILTTNLKGSLDPAFLRRIRFIVNFPFPDTEQRARIWRRVFPAEAPVENVDVQKLARLNVAGGNIRNIAVHAAFLAAEEGVPIRMRHLARAAHGEMTKLEKPFTEKLGEWM